jgi:hypothetical protein
MITDTGKELDVIIVFQWAKRLQIPVHYTNPIGEVKITVDSIIDTTDKKSLNWLHVTRLAQHNKLIGENLLIVEPLTMVLSPLCPKEILDTWNLFDRFQWFGEEAWLLKNILQQEIESRIDDYYLNKNKIYPTEPSFVYDAKSTSDLKSIVSYKKGCGKWIHTATGCPFHNAAGLVRDEMTSNEREIIELWKKMVPLFSAAV